MSSPNWLEVLLFLSIGAFLLPALAGGRARAIAGIVIAGLAACGLVVLAIHAARTNVTYQSSIYYQTTGSATVETPRNAGSKSLVKPYIDGAEAPTPIGASLDPVQFEHERAEIERQWHDAELERRLWHAGSLAGGLFALLAIATAYLKLDLHSSGRYRTRLRLAAAGALALATAAAAWAWSQPL